MRKIFLFLLLFLSLHVFADIKPIPVDQAFHFTAYAKDAQTAVMQWQIKPGYYLYKARFHFTPAKPKQTQLASALMPASETITHKGLGKFKVYTGDLKITIPVFKAPKNRLVLQVQYQGCSAKGFCYPPQSRVVDLDLAGHYNLLVQPTEADVILASAHTATKAAVKIPTNTSNKATRLLKGNHSYLLIILGFIGFGLLISFTPCVLPMIPILSSIIIGQGKIPTTRAFALSLAYVVGMACTYAIAGILFGFLGANIQSALQVPWVIILFSIIFVAMALSLFGFYNIELPKRLRHRLSTISSHQNHHTYIGIAVMGAIATLVLSPCVTPALVGVLGFISNTGNSVLGGVALFSMGIGIGIPLLLIGTFGMKALPKSGGWMVGVKYVLGVMMLGLAIDMLARLFPGPIILLLWAALCIGSAIYMGALSPAKTAWLKLRKGLGLLLLIYGVVLVIGAASGNHDPLMPLSIGKTAQQRTRLKFTPVATINEVKAQLKIATAKHQRTMLDFYADWCVSCKEMEYFTFASADVQTELNHYHLIRANVTKNDVNDKALEKYYGVVAPPTMIFFDTNGQEIKNSRIVGAMGADEFLNHLLTFPKS